MVALVVLNGDVELAFLREQLAQADWVVAADGGARQVTAAGGVCDVVVGDGDSLDAADLARVQAANPQVEVRRFPTAKDATDGELALRAAAAMRPERIVAAGGFGGPRLDHEIASVLLLANPELRGCEVVLADRRRDVRLVRRRAEIHGRIGDVVTLLAVGGTAAGVESTGLAYALAGRDLTVGASLGVSNELSSAAATIELRSGMVLLIHERLGAPDADRARTGRA